MKPKVTFLRDIEHGGNPNQATGIASDLADFINAAKSSIHIAIYDFRLTAPELHDPVVSALKNQASAGVKVKIAFDHGKPASKTVEPFMSDGADPAPKGTKAFLESTFADTSVQTKSIAGSKLMHNKYVIRDVNTPEASVWTGSTNFTDDAWSFQENNILQIASPDLSMFYETDFQELWVSGNIKSTGVNDFGTVSLDSTDIDVYFSPGEGETIDQTIASLISSATQRIKIASMILTSHGILAALDDALHHKQVADFGGVYDATQMNAIVKQWQKSRNSSGIAQTFEGVASHLSGKESVSYRPDAKHNFMHDKIVVCDGAVVTGSFNFSRSATQNAENVLVLHNAELADQYSEYIDQITAEYNSAS